MPNDRRKANRSVQQESDREGRIFTFKVIQLIWLLLGILEVLIALRIGLQLIGANPANPIVAFIYGFTFLFLFPFAGMIASPTSGSSLLDLSSVFAMLVYALVAWAVERTVWLLFYRPRWPVVDTTQTARRERRINP
jgi:hypothetical protein